ncbi:hypothetical protein [Sphingobium sp. KCTC 72723]|uniref:hypothetical protein n=1 Tax=Sphingobium sp. KCTC 72723 TaxID=2733867 RepID=UPI00165D74C0|nr:hypothetical protein [Sphingobium sp. KCTC 72723]
MQFFKAGVRLASMTMAAKILGLFWAIVILPGMMLGALWSGSMPVWPAVVSGTDADFLHWVLLFSIAYGTPFIAGALFVFGRYRAGK